MTKNNIVDFVCLSWPKNFSHLVLFIGKAKFPVIFKNHYLFLLSYLWCTDDRGDVLFVLIFCT